jgi:3-hydroxyacyl-[acyl-carrier-protein] dehydratase
MNWKLIDRIDQVTPHERIVGVKTLSPELPLFADHFPGFPVIPGVLLIEMLAQIAGKLVEVSVFLDRRTWVFPILSIVREAKFRKFIHPQLEVTLDVTIKALREESAVCRGTVLAEGQRRGQVGLIFAFDPQGLPNLVEGLSLEQFERREMTRLGYPMERIEAEWARRGEAHG